MSERSIEVFGHYQQAQEKFDYFVCGVAGALFAYLGEHYTPRKLEFGASALEPLALLLLGLSFFFGIWGIEWANRIKKANHVMLHAGESAGKMTKALAERIGIAPFYNEESGEMLSAQQIEAKRQGCIKQWELAQVAVNAAVEKEHRLRRIRNVLLCLGFFAVFGSKVLSPYFPPKAVLGSDTTNAPVATLLQKR